MIDCRLEREGRTLRLVFPGDVLSTNAGKFKEQALAAIEANPLGWDSLEADLSAARMVDSVGLNLLVTLIKTSQAHGRNMRIRSSSSHVRRALRFTRLDQMAEVVGA
jgi:anti-anti-sigma factor